MSNSLQALSLPLENWGRIIASKNNSRLEWKMRGNKASEP